MEDVTVFKLVSIVCIWLVGFGGGLFPVFLASKRRGSLFLQQLFSLLNAFSGGVFLAGGFLHLLDSALDNKALSEWSAKYEFPLAQMFCTLGFLGVFLLELAAHSKLTASTASTAMQDTKTKLSPTSSQSKRLATSKPTTTTRALTTFTDQDPKAQTLPDPADDDLEDDAKPGGGFYDPMDSEEQEQEAMLTVTDDEGHHRHHHGHERHGHNGHGHSHGVPGAGNASSAVALVLFIALSFHSVMEGLGIGAQDHSAWGVFLAIVVHKGLAAFALGSELASTSMAGGIVILYMVVFSFMSILGIFIGWAVANASAEDSAAAGICVALASGTFIYVAVMEVIPQEFRQQRDQPMLFTKAVALCMGYTIFGLLAFWT